MRKKTTWLLLVFLACAALVISGCDMNNPVTDEWWVGGEEEEEGNGTGGGGGGGGGFYPGTKTGGESSTRVIPITVFTVTFDMTGVPGAEYFDANNGNQTTIKSQLLEKGNLVQEPGLVIIDGNPDDGHHDTSPLKYFDGWYTDPTGGTRWDFSSKTVDEAADLADGTADGIIELYPRWGTSGSTVTFDLGGDFNGDNTINSVTEIDASHTIYVPEPEYVGAGVPLSQPKGFGLKPGDPLANDYVFTGWYIDNDPDGPGPNVPNGIVDKGDTKWDFTDPVPGNMTLYAGWGTKRVGGVIPPENGGTPKAVYTVTFDSNGGDPLQSENVLDGNPVPRPDTITNPGYAFNGWHIGTAGGPEYDFDAPDPDPVTGPIILVADWVPTAFKVNFEMEGGTYVDSLTGNGHPLSAPPQQEVASGSVKVYEPGLVKDPSDRYFGGWYTLPVSGGSRWVFGTSIADGAAALVDGGTPDTITLYARWSDTGSTVRFDAGGDFDGNGSISSGEIDFSKTNYTPNPEYVVPGVPLSQPKGFELNSGGLADKYDFTGWYTDNNNNKIVDEGDRKWDFDDPVPGNMTLYAGWGTKRGGGVIPPEEGGTPTPVYTVTFNDNGADDTDSNPATKAAPDETVVLGDTLPMPDAIYKDGYVFSGWYKDAGLNTPWDFNTPVAETDDRFGGGGDDNSFTLYAKWELKPYTYPWFTHNYWVLNDVDMENDWYPFQCNPGEADWFYEGDDTPDDTANFNNQMTVVESLKDNPNAVALIVGYKDDPNSAITEAAREEAMRASFDDMGVSDQLVKYTDYNLPAGALPAGRVPGGPSGGPSSNDEVRIYVFLPRR